MNKGEFMYKHLLNHEKYILKILQEENIENLGEITEFHLNQISFFQHERLIHLIVTMSMGIILVGVLAGAIISQNQFMYLAVVVIIITEGFYIRHYYRMENGVQRLYEQYNLLREKREEIHPG